MSADLLFLDSADLLDVQYAAACGVVSGVTTNPTLLHAAAAGTHPLEHLASILRLFPDGPVFLQLHANDPAGAMAQADRTVQHLADGADRVVFKLPAQLWWFGVGARLRAQGHRVAMTAVYTPGQVLAAVQCGASWVIPYVDRAHRLRPGDGDLVALLTAAAAGRLAILAASIKNPTQAAAAICSGASAVTASWPTLAALMQDDLTDSAVEEFHETVPTW